VLRQTHKRVELVVVDDASSDHSPEEVARALEQASSVPWQLIRLRHNIGLPAARNIGVKLARGEFVFILDADNHLLPWCLEDHVHAAEKSGADAAYGMVKTFGTVSRILSDADFSAQRLARGPYIDAMALFRRSALMEMGLYAMEPELYGWEDYELWVRIAALARPVTFVPSVLSHYRFHQTNMISIASLDTRGAWAYLFSTYPGIFGEMSAEKQEQEAERRALQVGESADLTFQRDADVAVDCGCEDLVGGSGVPLGDDHPRGSVKP
jgi:glycosyltransferase involved in cell wall biosynthesis